MWCWGYHYPTLLTFITLHVLAVGTRPWILAWCWCCYLLLSPCIHCTLHHNQDGICTLQLYAVWNWCDGLELAFICTCTTSSQIPIFVLSHFHCWVLEDASFITEFSRGPLPLNKWENRFNNLIWLSLC